MSGRRKEGRGAREPEGGEGDNHSRDASEGPVGLFALAWVPYGDPRWGVIKDPGSWQLLHRMLLGLQVDLVRAAAEM